MKNLAGQTFEPPNDPTDFPSLMANFDPDLGFGGGLFEETGEGLFFPGTTHTLQSINPGLAMEPADPCMPSYMAPWLNNLPAGELHPQIDELAMVPNTTTLPNGGPAIEFTEILFGADLHCGVYDPNLFGSGPPNFGYGPRCPNPQSGVSNESDPPLQGTWPFENRIASKGQFKAPPLRNIELTGPYFHTGSYLTLRQVVDFYLRGGDFPATNAEHRDAHMLSIDNQAFGFGATSDLPPGFGDAFPDVVTRYDAMPDIDHPNTPEPATSTPEQAREVLVKFLISLTDERVKFERAPFDRPEIFVPLDGTAPDNTGGRAAMLTDSRFLHVVAVGAEGRGDPVPNFLGISSTPVSGLNNDHFDPSLSITEFLSENFDDGNFNGWTISDQGTLAGPSVWSAATGTMVQSSNIYSEPTSASELAKLGTYASYTAGNFWADYRATLNITSNDDDAIGLMFRYQNSNNYYRFSWDKQRNYRRLIKKVNGVTTLLAQDSIPYVTGQSYQLQILALGTTIGVSIDGTQIFSVTDSSLSSGTISLYSWGNAGSNFDDIVVQNLGGNFVPVISSVTATPSTINDGETSQLQVTASDPDSSPGALTYNWIVQAGQGSVSNSSIANPVYTPPDVASTQNFTLTVEVSDGADTTTDTVTVTVQDAAAVPLLSEDFADGDFVGWTIIDQGPFAGPSSWSAATGTIVQSSNIYSEPTLAPELNKLGTIAVYDAGSGWTDYQVVTTISSDDDDSIGLLFRYQDTSNYYKFCWDKQRSVRRLLKKVGGTVSLLAFDSVPYVTGQNYTLRINVSGSSLQVRIDGSLIFSVTDSSLSLGSIALYSWGNAGSFFDDIMVTD